MKKLIIFFLFIILFSCGKWKTNKLKSELLCTINAGNSPGNVMLKYDEDILDVSFRIEVKKNNIYIADNILKRVQVLDKNCELLLLIGDKKPDVPEKSLEKFSKFQFSIIEAIAVDSSGNIYIQNSFSPSQKYNQQNHMRETGISLSYILVFDNKGSLLYTLGRTGSPDIPFTSIESLTVDQNDRLFVITRSYDMWTVYRFTNKRRDLSINFVESDLKEQDGKDSTIGKIEKILIYESGDELLISAGYYNAVNFKYRKIYTYSIKNEKDLETAFIIDDHKNELFNLVDDKHLFLWDIDEQFIKYIVCSLNGEIVTNVSIKFSAINSSFDEILADSSGNFYSYHASKKGVEVLEWR
ncbi:MAG: hypothetical protein JXN64_08125 [Spirochaetes bacterium]|nr:hypothetical protein [Spirochaetota bacterium]